MKNTFYYFFLLIAILGPTHSLADEPKTLPFIVRTFESPIPYTMNNSGIGMGGSYMPYAVGGAGFGTGPTISAVPTQVAKPTESVVNVSVEEIRKVISNARDAICITIPDSEFKIWLKVEASGKILGTGMSSESGIEVTIKCSKKTT